MNTHSKLSAVVLEPSHSAETIEATPVDAATSNRGLTAPIDYSDRKAP